MKIKTFEINQFNESLQMYVMLSVTGALNLPLSLSLSLLLPSVSMLFICYCYWTERGRQRPPKYGVTDWTSVQKSDVEDTLWGLEFIPIRKLCCHRNQLLVTVSVPATIRARVCVVAELTINSETKFLLFQKNKTKKFQTARECSVSRIRWFASEKVTSCADV